MNKPFSKYVNGIRFVALRRVFRAAAANVPALQYANPESDPVRRPLPKGEGFEGHWLVEGDDGRPWIITRWWSRIPADLCVPTVALTDLPETDLPRIDVAAERVA